MQKLLPICSCNVVYLDNVEDITLMTALEDWILQNVEFGVMRVFLHLKILPTTDPRSTEFKYHQKEPNKDAWFKPSIPDHSGKHKCVDGTRAHKGTVNLWAKNRDMLSIISHDRRLARR